jgi:hypothetical protein
MTRMMVRTNMERDTDRVKERICSAGYVRCLSIAGCLCIWVDIYLEFSLCL